MTKARDLSKLLSTANGKIAGTNLDVSFENISDTGTEGTKVAVGTTAQRGSTQGQWRFNSTTGFFEGRNASDFSTLEPTPTVTSVDVTEVASAAGGNETFVITGTNFATGGSVKFVGNDNSEFSANSTTINSATQVTAVAPKASFSNAKEPFKIGYSSQSGLTGVSASGLINVDNAPSWSTSAGSLGNVSIGVSESKTVTATDAEGDTVAYSKTSGSFPTGMTLNTSTGVISGTVSGSASTYNFDMRATAGGKTADRSFSIVSVVPVTGGSIVTYSYGGTNYKLHIFTSNGTFTRSTVSTADILVVGGGGGAGFGGGGAGALVWGTSKTLSDATYSVTIGAGGLGTANNSNNATNGADSSFGSLVVAEGGGAGGRSPGISGGNNNSGPGANGGSGGGGGHPSSGDAASASGGSAITGSSTGGTIYGYNGGNGFNCCNGGGGGGSGQAGQNGVGDPGSGENVGGNGHSTFVGDAASTSALLFAADLGTNGSGAATSGLSSDPGTLYLAGGGGGAYGSSRGGYGGGGTGGVNSGNTSTKTAGLTNSGSGGGGANSVGQNGGTGVVLVRYVV
jgi:hypothetical protein